MNNEKNNITNNDNQIKVKAILEEHNMYHVPVNIIMLAEMEGFTVLEADMKEDGFIAVSDEEFDLHGQKLKKAILVNRKHSFERKVFTIAHELGHWFLDCNRELKNFTGFRDDNINENHVNNEPDINSFASELLMPEGLLTKFIDDNIEYGISINKISDNFVVSRSAAKVRFEKYLKTKSC